MAGVRDVKSKTELDEVVNGGKPVVLHFWASWCDASKQMDQIFSHLATDYPQAFFYRVEAEEQPEISDAYTVAAVPFFAFCKDGKTVDKLEGANPSGLAEKVAKLAGPAAIEKPQVNVEKLSGTEDASGGVNKVLKSRLEKLINSNPVFLFMKGSPEEPKCKFSRKVTEILKEEGISFGSFDILTDDEVREGLKVYSNWPTYPQLYFKGELLGGCDIVVSMKESGELQDLVEESNMSDSKEDSGLDAQLMSRLKELINSSPVMVFMKGSHDEPKCGFSGKLVAILKEENVPFKSFDILSDEAVRQGLKVFSKWPSYPQLYIKGELIGGSDIVLEMQKTGELKSLLEEKGIVEAKVETLEDRLKHLVSSSPVMLFMKGTPDAPKCGFSTKVVNALREEEVEFGSFDILSDEEVRQGLKSFSNWPTYPQLYYKGELIGGCDIVLEMHNSGELKETLSE
ncbi:Monothiol glutaredoxin-S17 protein [Rhynchospora pubera]|uniref:Monothiol glutaredoxin-S17 protein n=1 Tax=Rhynchospora pubera TaxID=906938 RepID=A0AAV8GDC6_9POAL|nr:Monothiol glutaredoxin-S17 protein [Rhynchospora pubera]